MNLKFLNIIGIKDLINRIGKTIDNIVDSKVDKEKLKTELFAIIYQLDITSDSWLSKNIRPLTLLIGWGAFILFALLDGNGYEIQSVYRDMLGKWMGIITAFYFGLREVGKFLGKK